MNEAIKIYKSFSGIKKAVDRTSDKNKCLATIISAEISNS